MLVKLKIQRLGKIVKIDLTDLEASPKISRRSKEMNNLGITSYCDQNYESFFCCILNAFFVVFRIFLLLCLLLKNCLKMFFYCV